jgi:hypothetical protein
MVMRTEEARSGRGVHTGRGCLWGAGLAAMGALGCGVTPPIYSSPVANNYCTDFLRFAHACSAGNTAGFLICLCLTVSSGFLAAQLNNDQARESFFRKNQSTFLFVIAVLAGIMGAYFHSRADAASSAAAEVQSAMRNRGRWQALRPVLGGGLALGWIAVKIPRCGQRRRSQVRFRWNLSIGRCGREIRRGTCAADPCNGEPGASC